MNQIDVYQTDANSIFTFATKANELAQSPGTFNIPYGAKLSAPPARPAGKAALAVGESWILVDDHSATAFYRKDTGDKYEFNTAIIVSGGAVIYSGYGDVPAWLTTDVEPEPPEAAAGE